MDLRDYLNVLIKRGWIVLLVAVVTASSAFAFSKLQTVVYRSSIQLNVIPGRLDRGLQQTIKNLMRNYSGEIKSRTTAQKIMNRQQLDLTVDDVLAMMTVSPIESDFLMQIDIDDIDGQRAQLIAQTAAEIFVEDKRVAMLEQEKRDRVDVTIRDNAAPPRVFWPKTTLLVLAAGLVEEVAVTISHGIIYDLVHAVRLGSGGQALGHLCLDLAHESFEISGQFPAFVLKDFFCPFLALFCPFRRHGCRVPPWESISWNGDLGNWVQRNRVSDLPSGCSP